MKESSVSQLAGQHSVTDAYVLKTLMYTPIDFAQKLKYMFFVLYPPNESQTAITIFRFVNRYGVNSDPSRGKEITFQDQIYFHKGGCITKEECYQIDYSVYVDPETYKFRSVCQRPKQIAPAEKFISRFEELLKQKGTRLTVSIGTKRFESDGSAYRPLDEKLNAVLEEAVN